MEKERRVVGSLFQRDGAAIQKKSIREFESRSEFRMSQIKTVRGACGTCGLNIKEAIEV